MLIKMNLYSTFAPEIKDPRAAQRIAYDRYEETGDMWKYDDVVVDEYGRY